MAVTNKTIGRKVRDLRKAVGMTGAQLAERLGLTQAQVSRLEAGLQGYRWGTLSKLCKILGVHPAYFYMDESSPYAPPYGLLAGGKLRQALKHREYREFVEMLAREYSRNPESFHAIAAAAKVIARRRSSS